MRPAKAIGQKRGSFGRNTHVAPSNIVLDSGLGLVPHGKGVLGLEPPVFSDAA